MNRLLPVVGQALSKAGVRLPTQMQMVWQWLKDQPNKRMIDVRGALPIPASGVSSLLTNMRVRGMVKREMVLSLRTKKRISSYSAVGDVYELLPEPNKPPGAQTVKWRHKVDEAPVIVSQELATITPDVPVTSKIDSLTIGEARELYAELKKFFG